MKKKLLFVIPSLDAGGAEKSLINLLNTLDENKFEVDLFMFNPRGLFLQQLPEFVRLVPRNLDLEIFQQPLMKSLISFLKEGKISQIKERFLFFCKNFFINNKGLAEQYSWQNIRNVCTPLEEKYDVAIGFLEKSSIYYVVDKVQAHKKIAFIHTFYSKLGLDVNFDRPYFQKVANIAGVSNDCADNLKEIFPAFKDKIFVMPNIVSSRLIHQLALENLEDLPQNTIVSVGRLVTVKGFDLAVEAARILKEKNVSFYWYIIGEGSERSKLEDLIENYELQNCFKLLGLKENPYPYIRKAKVFVQTSKYEGKSIAVDEAKILGKPIILTNFSTAKDQIEHGNNGLICSMNPEDIAGNIIKYFTDSEFTDHIIANLRAGNWGTDDEIDKFYELINE